VSNPSAERGQLVFGHARWALLALGALGALIGVLAWLDEARSQRELEHWRGHLCAELPAELVKGLGALSRDAVRAPDAARQALAVLAGLPGATESEGVRARILFETARGWRELRAWSDELDYTHDRKLLAAVESWRCEASLARETLRVVRPLQTSTGVVVLLVLERPRH
jgi:hypothetical protein